MVLIIEAPCPSESYSTILNNLRKDGVLTPTMEFGFAVGFGDDYPIEDANNFFAKGVLRTFQEDISREDALHGLRGIPEEDAEKFRNLLDADIDNLNTITEFRNHFLEGCAVGMAKHEIPSSESNFSTKFTT